MTGATAGTPEAMVFEEHRMVLFGVAYRMLGSVTDAEDVVQDAWLRWTAADRSSIEQPRAYLVRIVTNTSLNRLRSAQVQRESYVGPWLPEPLLVAPDIAENVETAESVSMAVLVVLETLTPLERAVFVLHEVFGYSHGEIAASLGRSEAGVRQLAHRAREHVQARRPRFAADRQEQRRVTEQFLAACVGGDLGQLMSLLAPGVRLVSDSGGKAKAPRRIITGADKVARFLLAVAGNVVGLRIEIANVNGAPGIVGFDGPVPIVVLSFDVVAGQVQALYLVNNPDKLNALAVGAQLRR
ncbi:MAG TPA: RNA polymerase sigma-70 factor [Streptosporangiaceae bacterium]|nr:RNA polymerase sigma-70 factor [Streptosporangiaceae bacterium]